MNRRWAPYHGLQRGDQNLGNLCQQHPGVPGSPFNHGGRLISEEVVSVPPSLIFSDTHPTMKTMPSRGKASKVIKTGTAPRRGSRYSPLPSTAHDHLEALVHHASNDGFARDAANLGHSSMADSSSHLGDSVQLSDTGVLSNTAGSISSLQQALEADEGLQLDQHHFSDSLHTPSPGPTESASVSERSNCCPPSRTAADVAMEAYGDNLRIDSALCKKLAGEAARREPTQRRSDQKLNIERRSNVEALLAHVTGEVAARPCKNCHKGHGPWTQCVVYDGQMCGSCTNCWFNASGSRCTFHENNNPQPPHFAPSAAGPSSSQVAQPVATYQQLSTAATPPVTSLQSDILHWALADETRQFLSQTMGDIVSLTRRGRYIARIEAAAKELGMRIAEYDEYLQTPEGIAEQQRLEQDQLSQSQAGDMPMDDNSPGGPLT
ncbi:hypothetical protein J3458_008860 [Metarhizium acridum]|uniref:Uncharacterized protein n=1 Tax=Metarhizium acridum (strain CQMa 102) TaxID=655827 RepID=E9E5A9_METAQ|nr:uncharacterized protein MAC_04985 [Metarhizium acridum CQMa 102]EFY88891.1 hypothetical protein MAC_04985 [Metarhizium acridum CQMa 102]KAG8414973.1 hypothetical protein J3458_008860 [Metarhizium acridum]